MKRLIFTVLLCIFSSLLFAETPTNLQNTQQLILVTTTNWDTTQGTLQRYARDNAQKSWQRVGEAIPVVVGKNGLAWGIESSQKSSNEPHKKEGDLRTPVGIYPIGPSFGFATASSTQLPYLPITENTVCVDDANSHYYNHIVNQQLVKKDWNSGEQMQSVSLYKKGLVISYNHTPTTVNAGSCIFMHIWRNANSGTAGCIAMAENNLDQVLAWVDASKNPKIAIFPQNNYALLKKSLGLP